MTENQGCFWISSTFSGSVYPYISTSGHSFLVLEQVIFKSLVYFRNCLAKREHLQSSVFHFPQEHWWSPSFPVRKFYCLKNFNLVFNSQHCYWIATWPQASYWTFFLIFVYLFSRVLTQHRAHMLTLQEKKVRLASAVLLFKYAHSRAAEVLRSAFFFSLVILMGIFWKKSKGNTDKKQRWVTSNGILHSLALQVKVTSSWHKYTLTSREITTLWNHCLMPKTTFQIYIDYKSRGGPWWANRGGWNKKTLKNRQEGEEVLRKQSFGGDYEWKERKKCHLLLDEETARYGNTADIAWVTLWVAGGI